MASSQTSVLISYVLNPHSIISFIIITSNIIFFIRWSKKKRRFFNDIIKTLENLNVDLEILPREERGTNKAYELLNDTFKNYTILKPIWAGISRNIVQFNKVDRDDLRLIIPAQNILNFETLTFNHNDSETQIVWNAVPQILTSMGIIGTFISIVTLLIFNLSNTIDNEFIIMLVRSLAIAFLSSLTGVFLAVIFVNSEKTKTAKVMKLIESINEKINSYFSPNSIETLLIDQNYEIANLASSMQTSIASGFNELKGGMGQALTDIMDDTTKETIKNGIANSFVEMNNIIKDLKEEQKVLLNEMQDLKETKRNVIQTINKINEDQSRINTQITVESDRLLQSIGTFQQTIAPLADVAKQIQSISDLSIALTNSIQTMVMASDRIKASVEQSDQISQDVVNKYGNQIEKINSEYVNLVKGIETWVNQSNSSLQINLGSFDKSVSNVFSQINVLSNSLATGVVSLERTVKNMSQQNEYRVKEER
ncbi:MAG: hypothetical protein ACXVCP_09550 [Bdellovibrio sp.]